MLKVEILNAFTDATICKNLEELLNDKTKVVLDTKYSTSLTKDGKMQYSVLVTYTDNSNTFTKNPQSILG